MTPTDGPGRPVRQEAGAAGQEKARRTAQVAQEKGQEVARTARESAAEVVQEASTQGRDLYEQAKGRATEEAAAQTQRLTTTMRHLAQDLQHMSETAKPDSSAAPWVGRIADRGHRLADRLDQQGPGELLDQVRDFARRRPGLFLAGAALAGFAAARLGRGVGAAESGDRAESRELGPAPARTDDDASEGPYGPGAEVAPGPPTAQPVVPPPSGRPEGVPADRPVTPPPAMPPPVGPRTPPPVGPDSDEFPHRTQRGW